ncbi:hypothetical protein P3S68_028218 [Capsicum galapagoense]
MQSSMSLFDSTPSGRTLSRVDDKVNGYLFPKENVKVLAQIMLQVVSNGELSLLACKAASVGQHNARNLMVS